MREATLSARAQTVPTLVTIALVAGICIAVILTSGRANANHQAVLSSIDSAGARSIIIRPSPGAHLSSDLLQSLEGVDGIDSAVALGGSVDVKNVLLPDGSFVPLRDYWGEGLWPLRPGQAVASSKALQMLGMRDSIGSVSNRDGIDIDVVGRIGDATFLKEFEPLLLTPKAKNDSGLVGVIVVVVKEVETVVSVMETIRPMMIASEGAGLPTIETSWELNVLRNDVDDKLSQFSSAITIGALVFVSGLVALVQTALVVMRRKDWGRRRALGASRSLVMGLLVSQAALLAVVGSSLGTVSGVGMLIWLGDPIPAWDFTVAVAFLATSTVTFASMVPAYVASRQDPIKELRVP